MKSNPHLLNSHGFIMGFITLAGANYMFLNF
jgi:hypothetical protein